jgi:hypothetical protein
MTDWSSSEKDKIWQAACDEHGNYQDLTFTQFKALIIGEGGFGLKDKVEGMAATAQAAQIDNAKPNEVVGYQMVGLEKGMRPSVSLPQLAPIANMTGEESISCAMPPADALGCESANSPGSDKDVTAAQTQGTSSTKHPQPGHDMDSVESIRKLNFRSHSGRVFPSGACSGDFSDSDDERDEDGNLQPKLLTKRRTGSHGSFSPNLRRSTSEGGFLPSPSSHHRPQYAYRNAPPVTPNTLPRRNRTSQNAATRGSSTSTHVHGIDVPFGASPNSVSEHGFTCMAAQEITGSSVNTSVSTTVNEVVVCPQDILLLCA